jgi:hypothetical protein
MGLERGPLSLVSTIDELLEREIRGSGLEIRNNGRRDTPRRPRDTPLSAQILALTWPTSGCRSVGIVRSPTKAMELFVIIPVTGCGDL